MYSNKYPFYYLIQYFNTLIKYNHIKPSNLLLFPTHFVSPQG